MSDLGSNVPTDSLVAFLGNQSELSAVGLGVTTTGNELSVQEHIAAVKLSCDVPVVVGGAAVPNAQTARALGADAWSGSDEQGLDLFETIARTGVAPIEDGWTVNYD